MSTGEGSSGRGEPLKGCRGRLLTKMALSDQYFKNDYREERPIFGKMHR